MRLTGWCQLLYERLMEGSRAGVRGYDAKAPPIAGRARAHHFGGT